MDVKYRKFQKCDFYTLSAISDDEWRENNIKIAMALLKAEDDIEQCVVAEIEGELIGYIYGFVLPNGTLIPEFLFVQSKYRKRGIGTNLLHTLETISGCNTSMIFYNKSLSKYYENQGYSRGDNLEVAIKLFPK